MENEFVTEGVCTERYKRLAEEDKRQNERIKKLEDSVAEINRLAVNTEKLATSLEQMVVEQKEQGRRISKLEGRDGEKWRDIVKIVGTAILGVIVGAILAMVGIK